MLDVSVSYSRFRFLGSEFLTWLWFALDTMDQPFFAEKRPDLLLERGGKIVLEKRQANKAVETISIQGEDATLAEGRIALQKGAKVSEVNLILRQGDRRWQFSLKADSFHLTGLKTPENLFLENEKDFEAALLDRIYQVDVVYQILDDLYGRFLKERLTPGWPLSSGGAIRGWIGSKIED
jgi:hypothetical protein